MVDDKAQARDERRMLLTQRLFSLDEHIEKLSRWATKGDINGFFAQMCILQAGEQVDAARKELSNIKKAFENHEGGVTDEMVDQAREVNIESVVEFTRGKAVAWCHEDRNPSMFHAKRINKACCPVCDKYFDTIAVLMERDGLPFYSAVKQLIGGY